MFPSLIVATDPLAPSRRCFLPSLLYAAAVKGWLGWGGDGDDDDDDAGAARSVDVAALWPMAGVSSRSCFCCDMERKEAPIQLMILTLLDGQLQYPLERR